MFDLFTFTDKTLRLRRNLLIFSLLCFCVGHFNISISQVPIGGLKINLPQKAVEFSLLSMLIYHFITFYWASFDEFKHWRLKVADKQQWTLITQLHQKFERLETGRDRNQHISQIVFEIEQQIPELPNMDEKQLEKLQYHLKRLGVDFENHVLVKEAIETSKELIDTYSNYKDKYRAFTILRIGFVEFTVPAITTVCAVVWGVLNFKHLWN